MFEKIFKKKEEVIDPEKQAKLLEEIRIDLFGQSKTEEVIKRLAEAVKLHQIERSSAKELITSYIIKRLKWSPDFDRDIKIIQKSFPHIIDEILASPEIKEQAVQSILERTKFQHPGVANICAIKEKFLLPDDLFNAPEIQQNLIRLILLNLKELGHDANALRKVIRLKSTFDLKNIPYMKDVEEAAKSAFIYLSKYEIDEAEKVKKEFLLSDDFAKKVVLENVKNDWPFSIGYHVSEGEVKKTFEHFIRLKAEFDVPDDLFNKTVISALLDGLTDRHLSYVYDDDGKVFILVKKYLSVPQNILFAPNTKKILQTIMANSLRRRNTQNVLVLEKELSLPRFMVHSAAVDMMSDVLLTGEENLHIVNKARNELDLPESIGKDIAVETIRKHLEQKDIDIIYIQQLIQKYNLTENEMSKPDMQAAAQKCFVNLLSKTDLINVAATIRNIFHLTDEFTSSFDIQKKIMSNFVAYYSKYNLDDTLNTYLSFNIRQELLNEAGLEVMCNLTATGKLNLAKKIKEALSMPESFFREDKSQERARPIYEMYVNDNYRYALIISDYFVLSPKTVHEASVNFCRKAVIDGNKIYEAVEFINKFSLFKEDFIFLPEVQDRAKKIFVEVLGTNNLELLIKIKNAFSLTDEFSFSTKNRSIALSGVKDLLAEYDRKNADNFSIIKAGFSISESEIRNMNEANALEHAKNGKIDLVVKLREIFPWTDEFTNNPELFEAASQGFSYNLLRGNFTEALKMTKEFNISPEVVKTQVEKTVMAQLNNDDIIFVKKISNIMQLNRYFPLPRDFVTKKQVADAFKKSYIKSLAAWSQEYIESFRENFKIHVKAEEVLTEFPEIRKIIDRIRVISPELARRIEVNVTLISSLAAFIYKDTIVETLTKNPFILDAICNNLKFGIRLAIKFPNLDKLSQNNIRMLFDNKKKILEEKPDIDPQSTEFRILMQEKLKKYGVNTKVAEEAATGGIKFDEWLNYGEKTQFKLETKGLEEVKFSEVMSMPLKRIQETVDIYAKTVKETLVEYREELKSFQTNNETTVLGEQSQKMAEALELATSRGNEKEIAGIKKGIENLAAKASKAKGVSIWDSLSGKMASFTLIKNDVVTAQDKLIDAEQQIGGSTETQLNIVELKKRKEMAKEEFVLKFAILERRIEEFRSSLKDLISQALGDDRAVSLVQEIDSKLSEHFDHFTTDKELLKSLLKDNNDKNLAALDGHAMNVSVWTRNPDIDLYQGNYSPCCVSIDNDVHGSESPITDYNTDLGIQIVNVWDETIQEPVVAAWCWLGKDSSGNKALVIDNLEARPDYCKHFSGQLSEQIFAYIKKYAQTIGVNRVVLGEAQNHNDLPTESEIEKLEKITNQYSKIGGANRAVGYYLEAEDDKVMIVADNIV
jgi:hypothetical protein